jgi:hypothetical protein
MMIRVLVCGRQAIAMVSLRGIDRVLVQTIDKFRNGPPSTFPSLVMDARDQDFNNWYSYTFGMGDISYMSFISYHLRQQQQ